MTREELDRELQRVQDYPDLVTFSTARHFARLLRAALAVVDEHETCAKFLNSGMMYRLEPGQSPPYDEETLAFHAALSKEQA